MKIALFSNFVNHHQMPLCEEFLKNKGIEFVFVECKKMPIEREKMGYKKYDNKVEFIIKAYEEPEIAERIALTFDVCIFGADSQYYVEKRMEKNLLSFRYIERIFKKGKWRYLIPKVRNKIKNQYLRYKDKNFYILCASGYTASDLVFCGFPASKCFQWGYFPENCNLSYKDLIKVKSKDTIDIIYVGRLLKLKKVKTIIDAFNIISKKHTNLHLSIVGDGPERDRLKKIAFNRSYSSINFTGFKSIEETRHIMEQSHILILASNFYEGWGAVINEAMSSACIPICSHSVGSAPVLIKNGINGYIFKLGHQRQLALKIECAVQNLSSTCDISINAYESINKTWNANLAVNRFLELSSYLLTNTDYQNLILFDDGPCAKSKIIKNNWFRS